VPTLDRSRSALAFARTQAGYFLAGESTGGLAESRASSAGWYCAGATVSLCRDGAHWPWLRGPTKVRSHESLGGFVLLQRTECRSQVKPHLMSDLAANPRRTLAGGSVGKPASCWDEFCAAQLPREASASRCCRPPARRPPGRTDRRRYPPGGLVAHVR